MSLAREFRVGVTTRPSTFNQDVKALIPAPDVDGRYLARYLRWLEPKILASTESATHGTKRLPSGAFESLPIPLPPLPEQRRIADILDKADAIRRKRKEAIALTEQLLRSTFLEMFGDPVTNPKGWEVRPLGEVVQLFAGNSLPPGEPFVHQPGGVLLLKVGDMNAPGNETGIATAREWTNSTRSAVVAPAGAVVIPKRGGAIATNKKRILLRPAALDPNLMAIAPRTLINLAFLRQWFDGIDLASLSNGSAVPQLNKKDLDPIPIPIPPTNLQEQFSTIAGRIQRTQARLNQSRTNADMLFTSLVHCMFLIAT